MPGTDYTVAFLEHMTSPALVFAVALVWAFTYGITVPNRDANQRRYVFRLLVEYAVLAAVMLVAWAAALLASRQLLMPEQWRVLFETTKLVAGMVLVVAAWHVARPAGFLDTEDRDIWQGGQVTVVPPRWRNVALRLLMASCVAGCLGMMGLGALGGRGSLGWYVAGLLSGLLACAVFGVRVGPHLHNTLRFAAGRRLGDHTWRDGMVAGSLATCGIAAVGCVVACLMPQLMTVLLPVVSSLSLVGCVLVLLQAVAVAVLAPAESVRMAAGGFGGTSAPSALLATYANQTHSLQLLAVVVFILTTASVVLAGLVVSTVRSARRDASDGKTTTSGRPLVEIGRAIAQVLRTAPGLTEEDILRRLGRTGPSLSDVQEALTALPWFDRHGKGYSVNQYGEFLLRMGVI